MCDVSPNRMYYETASSIEIKSIGQKSILGDLDRRVGARPLL